MKKTILFLIGLVFNLAVMAQDAQTFGDVKVDREKAVEATKLPSLLPAANGVEVNDVTFTGKVGGVCQAKGCWMTIDLGNGEEMTVKFKDYAFFMPMDCSGKTIVAHGKLFKKTTSVAELRHLAEDAGKSKKEIKKIKKPKVETRFEADGVILL